MSTVVLSLFGDEIIPEQINAVGKSRAGRKPKPAERKEEIASATTEIEKEVPSILETETYVEQEAPVVAEFEARDEVATPIVELLPVEVEKMVAVVETLPEVPEVKQEEAVPIIEAVSEVVPSAPVVVSAHARVTKAKPTPAVKKAKPAVKKLAVKKEVVKKEKQEGRPILEGWTPDKQYYSIGEVASLFYVATSHIRFWTNEFALKVRTTRKGDRLYSPEQINELRTIYHLVKEKGYTIAGAKARLKDAKKTPVHTLDLRQSLLQLRNKLVDIKNQI